MILINGRFVEINSCSLDPVFTIKDSVTFELSIVLNLLIIVMLVFGFVPRIIWLNNALTPLLFVFATNTKLYVLAYVLAKDFVSGVPIAPVDDVSAS